WTSVTGWKTVVPLQPGSNAFTVVGIGMNGQAIAGASNFVSIMYNGAAASPVGHIVLNEIMNTPTVTGAQYVELYNTSSTQTFNLSGCQFHGLDYTFPPGSLFGPNSYLVLAANRAAFAAAYGATIPIFDTFNGTLQSDGETLTLSQPGTNGELVLCKVRYQNSLPWPADSPGASFQLIDPRQDNWRAGNWSAL